MKGGRTLISERTVYERERRKDFPGQVLARGPLLNYPIGGIRHFRHYPLLEQGIKHRGLMELNSVQKCVIPHFLELDECFIMGGSGNGKSLSYLMPMVGALLAMEGTVEQDPVTVKPFTSRPRNEGPQVVIACCNTRSASKIEDHVGCLLSGSNQRTVSYMRVCNSKDQRDYGKQINVDIVVTTLRFLHQSFNKQAVFPFGRLRYAVFEDIDTVLAAFPKEFNETFEMISSVISKHSRHPLQRVICGREWSREVEDLYMGFSSLTSKDTPYAPKLFINSTNAVVRYSQVKFHMHYAEEDKRIHVLVALLKSIELFRFKSTLVLCSTAEVAKYAHEMLKGQGIQSILAETDEMRQDTVNYLRSVWDNSSDRRIMVLNDDLVRNLKIYDATCLIHYDMPLSKEGFKVSMVSDRFLCMWENIRDISLEKVMPEYKLLGQELVSHFILSGAEPKIHKLKKFGEKMGCLMPEPLSSIAAKVDQEEEEKLPICSSMILFGRCLELKKSDCTSRHIFLRSELEVEPVVPRSGEIEVQIAECLNPSLFTARVLRLYECREGKRHFKTSWYQKYDAIKNELVEYYKTEANRQSPQSFEVGSLCAVENYPGEFSRARVERIVTRDEMKRPKQLKVYCIDTGFHQHPSAHDVYRLPDHLVTEPQLAVRVVLANLQPLDKDYGYIPEDTSNARKVTDGKILLGKVRFCLGETVWINPLIDFGHESGETGIVSRASIRLSFISQNIAEYNRFHLMNIFERFRQTGFECPELTLYEDSPLDDINFMSQFHGPDDDYRWAFATKSSIEQPENVEIFTSYSRDPHCIIGNMKKFDQQIFDLEKELNEAVEGFIQERCGDYAKHFVSWYELGMAVAVKDRYSDTWHRGLLTKIADNKEEFDVFLCDIGDTQSQMLAKELFPMPKKLVKKLPFQAISFELSHIKPESDHWTEQDIDELLKFTLDENNDRVELDVVVTETLDKPDLPCRCYQAFMFTSTNEDIGELLVKQGLARFVEDGEKQTSQVKSNLLRAINAKFDQVHNETDEEGDSDSDSDTEFDVVCGDISRWGKVLENLPEIRPGGSSSNTNTLQPTSSSTPAPLSGPGGFSSIRHPTVYWTQTNKEITLRVDLPDIKDYSVSIERKKVSVRILDPPDYGFDIECFGTISNDCSPAFITGQYMKITLKKRTVWEWPRLLERKEKVCWLKTDPSFLDADSDSENGDADRLDVCRLPPADNEDDGNSSSSAEEDDEIN